MPFTSFRDRLNSSHKQDREGPLLVRAPTHASDAETSTTGSGSSSINSTALYHTQLEALKKHPLSADPAQFIQDAITPMFTYNPKHEVLSLDDIEEYHMPRYFAPHYKYMLNCDELNTRSWIDRMKDTRGRCKRMRVRFQKTLVDTSERQSMQRALISLTYEVIIQIPGRDEEGRVHCNGIFFIEYGKIVNAMIVGDLHDARMQAPEIPACIVS